MPRIVEELLDATPLDALIQLIADGNTTSVDCGNGVRLDVNPDDLIGFTLAERNRLSGTVPTRLCAALRHVVADYADALDAGRTRIHHGVLAAECFQMLTDGAMLAFPFGERRGLMVAKGQVRAFRAVPDDPRGVKAWDSASVVHPAAVMRLAKAVMAWECAPSLEGRTPEDRLAAGLPLPMLILSRGLAFHGSADGSHLQATGHPLIPLDTEHLANLFVAVSDRLMLDSRDPTAVFDAPEEGLFASNWVAVQARGSIALDLGTDAWVAYGLGLQAIAVHLGAEQAGTNADGDTLAVSTDTRHVDTRVFKPLWRQLDAILRARGVRP